MIARFHATGASAGIVNSSYEFRIPTMIPETPSSPTVGNRIRESVTARSE